MKLKGDGDGGVTVMVKVMVRNGDGGGDGAAAAAAAVQYHLGRAPVLHHFFQKIPSSPFQIFFDQSGRD